MYDLSKDRDRVLLFQRYKNYVYRKALIYTKNHHDAEDIVQETFIKAFEYHYQLMEKIQAWLNVIAQRTAIDLIRKQKTRSTVALEDSIETHTFEIIRSRKWNMNG